MGTQIKKVVHRFFPPLFEVYMCTRLRNVSEPLPWWCDVLTEIAVPSAILD